MLFEKQKKYIFSCLTILFLYHITYSYNPKTSEKTRKYRFSYFKRKLFKYEKKTSFRLHFDFGIILPILVAINKLNKITINVH